MPNTGPYIQTACICEKVLQEVDGALSAIRIIDRQLLNVPANLSPDALPSVQVNHTLLICLKSGEARGSMSLTLTVEQPSGITSPPQMLPVFFEGEDRGVNIVLPMQLQLTQQGLYWFDLRLEDELLVRIPFRFIIQRVGATS
jgi:Family of unknown function (DUF6941)